MVDRSIQEIFKSCAMVKRPIKNAVENVVEKIFPALTKKIGGVLPIPRPVTYIHNNSPAHLGDEIIVVSQIYVKIKCISVFMINLKVDSVTVCMA